MLLLTWSSVLLGFWGMYAWLTRGRLTRHLGFLHYVLFFFSIYLGSFELYTERGGVNHRYLTSVMAYPVLSMVGMLVASLFEKRVYFPHVAVRVRRGDIALVVGLLTAFLAVYAVYLYMLWPNIPVLVLLTSGDAQEGRIARYVATKGYREIVSIGALVWFPRILIDYFVAFVAVFIYYHLRRRLSDYLGFVALLAGLVVLTVMANEKYPAVKLFVVLALCVYNARHWRINWRSVYLSARVALGVVLVVGGVYAMVSGAYQRLMDEGPIEAVGAILAYGWEMLTTRGVVGQSIPLYLTYELIPGTYDFFMGRTFTNPRGILPYEPVALPYLLYEEYHPPSAGGIRVSEPTVFFGEIYANFGLPISLASMFLFGFVVQVVHNRLSRRIEHFRTPFYVALFYMVMAYIGDLALGFTTPYFDERLYLFVALYALGGMTVALGRREPAGAVSATS